MSEQQRAKQVAGRDTDADTAFQNWVVADVVAALRPDHREVLLECFYRGRSIEEAADLLGITVEVVKARCHFALRAMRLALAEKGLTDD